ncbi:MAG TPA: hypothetical protein VGI59_03275 [Candidatus Udaeobacter sp.]
MSTLQEILTAMDKLTPDELRILSSASIPVLQMATMTLPYTPRCTKRSLMPTLILKKANQSTRFARSFQNGFPSRNRRPCYCIHRTGSPAVSVNKYARSLTVV